MWRIQAAFTTEFLDKRPHCEEPCCPPSAQPCVRGSLELSPMQQTPGCLAPPQCPGLPKIEVLLGPAYQFFIPKSAGRNVFPTVSADISNRKLSKGNLAEIPTRKLQLRKWLWSLTLPRHQLSGLLLTPSLCSHLRAGAAETCLHPGALTCQHISTSCPEPEGTDLTRLSLSYFYRSRPWLAPVLSAETGSGAEVKVTPPEWASSQHLCSSTTGQSTASQSTLQRNGELHLCLNSS